jgi:hypothetical protein
VSLPDANNRYISDLMGGGGAYDLNKKIECITPYFLISYGGQLRKKIKEGSENG